MWTKILQSVITSIVLPLLKDLVFMVLNMLKVRQIRKEKEEHNRQAAEKFEQAKTEQEIKDTFEDLP
jgi:uncharacterized membrane-anchored protein YitT (DUF2179 family)